MIKVIAAREYEELSARAADLVLVQVKAKPNSVLGLATGSTTLGLYKKLIEAYRQDEVSFAGVTTFNLDEYIGLALDDPRNFHSAMRENFFKDIDIKKENIFIPDGSLPPEKLAEHCQWYEQQIKDRGGIDLQILGLGVNGHIAFNEPGTPFDSVTHVVDLTPSTIDTNAHFFDNQKSVPRQAVTMGLATIMSARNIVLLASGKNKAEAVAAALNGPATEQIPASILQRHQAATFIIDQAAMGE